MEERIKEIMEDVIGIDADHIHDDFNRNDAELWDSMNHLRMITALEESFSIRFTMQEIQDIESYRGLLNAVRIHVATHW